MADLFDALRPAVQRITDGVTLLAGYADPVRLMPEIERVAQRAAFRHMSTPGGRRMSAAMSNCGDLGWVSDRHGYRYQSTDPLTGDPWPAMPACISKLATDAAREAGFSGFEPDACLLNRYAPGAQMGAHQDRDEESFAHPIVSISLGLSATFLYFGAKRAGTPAPIVLTDGDVLVIGGIARLAFHGVRKIAEGHSAIGNQRINLTLRRAR